MNYPIVSITTKDKLILNWLFLEKKNSKRIVINIHGSASNFYDEPFFENMAIAFQKNNFSWLSTNNRGNSVLTHTWQKTGSAVEKFEDCVLDIDAWIGFAIQKGYTTIVLQGHSLGTEKIVYYMNKGKFKNKISGIILLGFSDSFGCTHQFMNRTNCKKGLFDEAKNLIEKGQWEQFLTTQWYSHAGVLPKGAESFINQFSDDSELSKAFPFRLKKLDFYSKIKVPILAVISDNEESEYTIISINESVKLLEKSNSRTNAIIIPKANHDFEHKEKELTKIVKDFLILNFK